MTSTRGIMITSTQVGLLYSSLSYKVQCFIEISGTDKTDNLSREIIYDNFTYENYHIIILASGHFILLEKTSLYKQKITLVLKNTRFISHVEHDIYFSLVHSCHV